MQLWIWWLYMQMAAVPLNNNDIFKKQLNDRSIVIELNKIAYY